MITDYIQTALARAKYEILQDDGCYYGHIPGFKGVWANAETLEECRTELQEVLEDWIVVSLRIGDKLPRLRGVKPFPRKIKIAS